MIKKKLTIIRELFFAKFTSSSLFTQTFIGFNVKLFLKLSFLNLTSSDKNTELGKAMTWVESFVGDNVWISELGTLSKGSLKSEWLEVNEKSSFWFKWRDTSTECVAVEFWTELTKADSWIYDFI